MSNTEKKSNCSNKKDYLRLYHKKRYIITIIHKLFSIKELAYIPKEVNNVTDKNYPTNVIGFNWLSVSEFFNIIDLMQYIASTLEKEEDLTKNKKTIILLKLNLLDNLNSYLNTLKLLDSYEKHPYSQLMIEQLKLFQEKIATVNMSPNDLINDFIKDTKQKLRSYSLQKKINQFTVSSTKNFHHLKKYCQQIKMIYADLQVICLTTHLLPCIDKDIIKKEEHINCFYKKNCEKHYTTLKENKARFLNQLKKTFTSNTFVGYAWSMHCIPYKGYTLQFLLFFNNSELAGTKEVIKNSLLKIWRQEEKDNLKYGINMKVTHNKDKDYQRTLDNYMTQMALATYYLKYKFLNEGRNFGRGRIFTKKIASLKKQAIEQANHWRPL